MRVAIIDGESAELVVLQNDGTRTEIRVDVDPVLRLPTITVHSTRKTAPIMVLVNGERKLP